MGMGQTQNESLEQDGAGSCLRQAASFSFRIFSGVLVFLVGNLWKVESSLGTFSGVKELAKDDNTENNTGRCGFFLRSVRFHFLKLAH